jgi:hypothetical protein
LPSIILGHIKEYCPAVDHIGYVVVFGHPAHGFDHELVYNLINDLYEAGVELSEGLSDQAGDIL